MAGSLACGPAGDNMNDSGRLEELERECRRLRRMFALLVTGVGIVVGVAWAGSADELVGRSLRLVDESGNPWLVAVPSRGGGSLKLSDGTMFGGIDLTAERDRKLVALRGFSGEPQVMLAKEIRRYAGVGVFDMDGVQSAILMAHPDGQGALLTFDREQRLAAKFPAEARWPIEALELVMKAESECEAFANSVGEWWLKHERRRPGTLEEVVGAVAMDPWGNPYRLATVEGKSAIVSAGPDGKLDNIDDIMVPVGW